MTLAQLIGQVKRHGHAVVCNDGKPTVRAVKDGAKLPDDLLAMLKERREEIIAWMNPTPEPINETNVFTPEDVRLNHEMFDAFEEWNRRITERMNGAATDETRGPPRRVQTKRRRGPHEEARQPGGNGGDSGGRSVLSLYAGHGD